MDDAMTSRNMSLKLLEVAKRGKREPEVRYSTPKTGAAQGSVLSPLPGNSYLHYVLDRWFETVVKPRLSGKASLVRYADDFVIGFELEADARRVMEVLPQRMGRYGLSLHPSQDASAAFSASAERAGEWPG